MHGNLSSKFIAPFDSVASQNGTPTDLDADGIESVERILRSHGITLPTALSAARRFSMACPALPTCGLAVAESERAIQRNIKGLEYFTSPAPVLGSTPKDLLNKRGSKEEKRKQLVEVLGKEHRIVLVEMTHDEGTTKAGFVVRLDGGNHLLLVQGAVPGFNGSLVMIRPTNKR